MSLPPASWALPAQGPPNQLALWRRRWAPPGLPATRATTALVAAGAAVAAFSVPFSAGIGWAVSGSAGVAVIMLARHVRATPSGPPPLVHRAEVFGWDRWFWGTATLALLGVGTFRAAPWLFALCLVVAAMTGTLALIGGTSLRAVAAAMTMVPLAALRSMRWLGGGLRPRRSARRGRVATAAPGAVFDKAFAGMRILATVGVSALLLLVFGGLLASADPAFGDALGSLVPTLDIGTLVRWTFVFAVAVPTLGGCVYLRAGAPDLSGLDRKPARKVNRLEWAVPLGLLTLLFAGFVAVQLAVLFGGARHVLETEGLTYARYARGGFWQLSIVTLLTLAVLGGAAYRAPRATAADRILLRAILGTLTLLTLVIVASALTRMNAYVGTYGLTELRLLVACCEGWLGLVLVLVLVAGVRLRAAWLPRTAIAAGVLALLALAAANPDRLIAENNLHRLHHRVDLAYLASLSADAVPALLDLPPSERSCVLGRLRAGLEADPADWRGWNLSRHDAEILLADYPAATWAVSGCPAS